MVSLRGSIPSDAVELIHVVITIDPEIEGERERQRQRKETIDAETNTNDEKGQCDALD